jgi:hypothetical protein
LTAIIIKLTKNKRVSKELLWFIEKIWYISVSRHVPKDNNSNPIILKWTFSWNSNIPNAIILSPNFPNFCEVDNTRMPLSRIPELQIKSILREYRETKFYLFLIIDNYTLIEYLRRIPHIFYNNFYYILKQIVIDFF